MISLYDSEIAEIMPSLMKKSPEVQALSYAISRQMKKIHNYVNNSMVYASIDTLPEEILDLLAVELRTQYYDETLEISVKRTLIKGTLLWYSKAGTPQAVAELVEAVFGEGEVEEWFDYGADPGYFKITTNAIMTPDMDTVFNKMINRVKNTRSHLQAVEIHRTIDQIIYFGASQHPVYKPEPIMDGYNEQRDAEQTTYAGTAVSYKSVKAEPIMDGYKEQREADQEIQSGTGTMQKYKSAPIMDGFKETGIATQETIYSGAAAGAGSIKPGAIIDGYREIGEDVEQQTFSGTGVNSRYKNTIMNKEE